MSSTSVNEKVQAALEEGHSWEDILGHLQSSEKPEYKDFLSSVQTATNTKTPSNNGLENLTPIIDWVTQNPVKTAGVAGAAILGTSLYNRLVPTQETKLKNRKLDIEDRRIKAYEQQVAKQGGVSQTELSPYEQHKLSQLESASEIARQKAIREAAITELKLAEVEAAKAKLNATPEPKLSPVDQKFAQLYEAQQAAKAGVQPPTSPATPPIAGGQPPAPPVAPNPVAQAAAQTAPVAPPTVAQIAQQTAPAITEAAQAPAAAIPPVKNQGGAPTKEQRAAAPFYLNKEEIRKSQGEMNSYLNMLGYDKKNPDSPRSQAAKVSFEMFMNEGLEGKIARGVSGKPVSHEGIYKPWLEKNFQFLPEQTQVFLLEQQQKASKRGVPPVVPPAGGAMPPSTGGGGGFLQKPTTPGGMLHNLNPLRLE